MAELWPRLRKYAKGEVRSGLNKIEIPVCDSSGEIIDFRTVSDASEMFQHLIHCNSQHFSQAENTPFVNGIFGKHLHPFQQNEFSESILEGTIDLTRFEINSAIAACISEMKFPVGENGSDTIKSTLTIDEFKQGFKLVAEKTSSSPSRRHLGHYKASLKVDILCLVYSILMSTPFEFGFTLLDRWLHALQVMLEKIKGQPCLDKLRVIQLLEADLNIMLCIILGCRLIHCTED